MTFFFLSIVLTMMNKLKPKIVVVIPTIFISLGMPCAWMEFTSNDVLGITHRTCASAEGVSR